MFSLNVDVFNVSGKATPALCSVFDMSKYLTSFRVHPPTHLYENRKRTQVGK